MFVGTKSLLFGVHQFLWHPITVFAAWYELYGMPNWKECVCIFIHDWGYWGCPNMDGLEGEKHPEFAATIAKNYLDTWKNLYLSKPMSWKYHDLCLYHSRHYARYHGVEPSMLCWADKLSIKYDPWWFYIARAKLSGELYEYLALHTSMGETFKTHREWYEWASGRAIQMGKVKNSDGISFHPSNKTNDIG
jgi:hypothetical protein